MKRLTPRQLTTLIGADAAVALMEEWGGHRLPHLPLFHVKRLERDRAIRHALDAGRPTAEIARDWGVDRSRVIQIGKR